MLEQDKPFRRDSAGDHREEDLLVGSLDARPARAGDALRSIEWSELIARLNAARELRRELRQEAMACVGATGARFGDAAASFFQNLGNGERPVNPEDLETCKTLSGTLRNEAGEAAGGDARDEK